MAFKAICPASPGKVQEKSCVPIDRIARAVVNFARRLALANQCFDPWVSLNLFPLAKTNVEGFMMPLTLARAGETNIIRKVTGRDEVRRHLAEGVTVS